ncbi:MAG: beta-ketoacyl-ACP synthase II [Bacteroidales bacterium]|jgi:3-oxoacyl-[acyl-carrier-protein] synthase II|nr:beta-ketoacyl-[acyl-carrier-protein] synthase II [Bacteroidales bacterium]MBP5419066.1 beta-ketoacyl-ACP synthase II [Bacteroidales bacterium]MCR5696188.1 beta-ketoacyl-ACP synthase II [Marinilabiliaceae bacterium]
MELRRVVVTGIGAITPLGNDVPTTWENLVKGVSGAGPITRFDASKFKTSFACEVKGYDPSKYFDVKEARKIDLFTQYAVVAADEAVKDSKLDLEVEDKNQIGVIWGAGIGGIKTIYDGVREFCEGDGTPRFNPFFIPKMIADIAPGYISIRYGFGGPNFGTIAACASSTNAIATALDQIRLGRADIIVSGGSEAALAEPGVGGFTSMKALSTRNDDPKTASRPFDKGRDGFVMGEGGACLILEEYEHAKKRGAHIYCEMVGGAFSGDAYHLTAPHPEGDGAARVMAAALKDAHLKPEDVDYINVHGTSTPMGDKGEVKAILKVFGESAYKLNISSTKSMTGHLLGATGALEAIVCVKAIENGIVPPTINHFEDDPEIDNKLNFTFNKMQKRDVKVALSNTFGFGGHNSTVIFKAL